MVSEKPWRLESLLRMLLRLFACFATGMVLASALRHWLGDKTVEDWMLNAIVATLCFQIAALVLIKMLLREHGISWSEAFGFQNEPGWASVLGVCVAVIGLPVCWWLQSHSADLLARFGFRVDEQDPVRLLRGADALWKQTYLAVFAVVLAPLAEELLFRGIAYPLLKRYSHPQFALWSTAMVFALIHGNLTVIVPLTFLAVVLTLLYEWTNNLLACIIVHSLFNAANFAMLFVLKNSGQLPGSP